MKVTTRFPHALAVIGIGAAFWNGLRLPALPAEPPPSEWIEPETGHRVVRLSKEPGSASFYFHQNAFTAEGDRLVINTPGGLTSVNLTNRDLDLVVPNGRYAVGGSSGLEVGRRSRQVYYSRREGRETVVLATHLDTKATREVGRLPFPASFGGVTADESRIIGVYNIPATNTAAAAAAADRPGQSNRNRNTGSGIDRTGGTGGPRAMQFFSLDLTNGVVTPFHPSTNWLNHVQCSPTDPGLVLFCHEGPWHDVDRVWTIRVGAERATLMHARTMPFEIAGHEFFSRDGRWVWYDLQTPRSQEFWLAGVHVETGERLRYPIARDHWSVHYNISWDGRLFAGDGGGPDSVANHGPLPEKRRLNPPGNGTWIYLFRPRPGEPEVRTAGGKPVRVGKLEVERLVNLSRHNYRLEPNVTFSPDGKWIVFRSNMHGPTHTYAVEVARAEQR